MAVASLSHPDGTVAGTPTTWLTLLRSRPLALSLALLSFGAGAIHFAVSPDHFAEYTTFGIFFAALAWFQILWAAVYLTQPDRWLAVAAALVNAGVVIVWVYSRTIGLPFGPDPGSTEVVGVADSISSAFEILLVGGLVAGMVAKVPFAYSRRWVSAAVIATVAVVVLTVLALVALAPTSTAMG